MLERSENAKSVPIGKIKSSNATVKEKHLGPSKGLKDESIVISKHRKTEIRGQKKTPVQSEPDLQQMEKPNRVLENGSGKKQQEKLQKPDQKSFELYAQEKPHKLIEDKHILEISAFEACWLKAQWEDTSKEVYLRPGESVSFKFSGKLKVKLGNSGGIKLKFDNENYQLDAESGQVKTLFFP
jgi:cytoskeleton protein RodZ